MRFSPTSLPDVVVIDPIVFRDERGFFMETWRRSEFVDAGIAAEFVQDNHSRSVKHTLRGLHYQIEHPQGKLVRATFGEVFDVAVDVRRSSPSFGRWVGEVLSAENKRMLWIPPGFAHGFYVLSDVAEVQYKCTDYYSPMHERCIRWDDPAIGIQWPLIDSKPVLSRKDESGALLERAEVFD